MPPLQQQQEQQQQQSLQAPPMVSVWGRDLELQGSNVWSQTLQQQQGVHPLMDWAQRVASWLQFLPVA
jgi:hypothetical protein